MQSLDYDGAVAVLSAVANQWARDAQRDEKALATLARWLEVEPEALRGRLQATQPPRREPRLEV